MLAKELVDFHGQKMMKISFVLVQVDEIVSHPAF